MPMPFDRLTRLGVQLHVMMRQQPSTHMSMYVSAVEKIPPYGTEPLKLPSSTTILSKVWDFSTVFYKILITLDESEIYNSQTPLYNKFKNCKYFYQKPRRRYACVFDDWALA